MTLGWSPTAPVTLIASAEDWDEIDALSPTQAEQAEQQRAADDVAPERGALRPTQDRELVEVKEIGRERRQRAEVDVVLEDRDLTSSTRLRRRDRGVAAAPAVRVPAHDGRGHRLVDGAREDAGGVIEAAEAAGDEATEAAVEETARPVAALAARDCHVVGDLADLRGTRPDAARTGDTDSPDSTDSTDGTGGMASFEVNAKAADVIAHFRKQAEAAGMKVTSEIKSGDTAIIGVEKPGDTKTGVQITATQQGAQVIGTITYGSGG